MICPVRMIVPDVFPVSDQRFRERSDCPVLSTHVDVGTILLVRYCIPLPRISVMVTHGTDTVPLLV